MIGRAYTVVIPAYNAARLIPETIASILAQTSPPERIIVVDDGSPDDTSEIVRGMAGPITYVRQDNTGPGGATTRGIAMVDTEFVATVDHDDLWVPEKCEKQIARMAADLGLAGVFGHIAEFVGDPAAADYAHSYEGWSRATMFLRTEVAKNIGPLHDHPSKLGEMIDWLARVREAGHRLEVLPEVLTLRRIHTGSLSARSREELGRGYLHVARDALRRRRQIERK